ncbi:bromodomain associated domain protein [Zymoseptoria brevis]|uniref:Transcription initiation factor TFIID subunit 8 n=1 Tax=Zymoseptoria brevis TaxID=1047168 RepID=A0A0F4GRM6_9PEZI|nr:bromodomain associated domain protein [Zymoseptoria brevis]
MASEPVNAHAGMKRSRSPSKNAHANKKRRVVHSLHHAQVRPVGIELAPQDPLFAQGQLLKSIGTALVLAGFDGVKATALEMFRAQVEEFMLSFLEQTSASMQNGRRTKPTALDFARALASTRPTHTASLLEPQLELSIPADISCPVIPDPDPAPISPPDFFHLLRPLITDRPPSYIPSHFPTLPPQHAWKQTAVFPEREKDARKMREKATEEGMLAENALRRLAAAAKTGAMNAERKRHDALSGVGKVRDGARNGAHPGRAGVGAADDTFAEVLDDIGSTDEVVDLDMDGTATIEDGVDLGMPEGVAVNHELGHWRKHGMRKAIRG